MPKHSPQIEFAKWTVALMSCGLVTMEAQLWAVWRGDEAIFYAKKTT